MEEVHKNDLELSLMVGIRDESIIFYISLLKYNIQIMSHLRIQRKRTESPRIKLHSEESKPEYPKYSVQRIIHENINKRRFTTHNSPNKSQKSEESFTTIKLDIDEVWI